ncbi:TolA-binding protein [Microbacterium sp. W4I4]|uniref:hypothetical protein n=1 Tax=Microbacterium sp. W4I4 TaxID=3042295 RepID=UPI00278A7585|nr:hypothetical protein [Microbacterium sp. W4I4]MDQ0614922.1 TolA-binding protein [Microbacterium sp. W4I4]
MTKQLITLIGALVSAAVIIAAVVIGVVPLVGGVFSADTERQQVAATNATYETQIATLTAQKEKLAEINAAVEKLRGQVPEKQLLNQVFERISLAATSAGVTVTAANRGDLAPYAPRTGTADAAASVPAPVPTPTPTTGTPIDGANDVADKADANVADADGATADGGTPAPAAPTAAASAREQVELSISVTAPDMASAFAFLDGLRAGPRAIAIDTATVSQSGEGFSLQVTVLAFLQNSGGE